jgi:uncharacterized protein (TIGR02996 family)
MTTEDDFQNVLTLAPRDWHTRLVFADWLDERGDPRAEGYRAMGLRRFAPSFFPGADRWVWLNARWAGQYTDRAEELRPSVLPDEWYDLLPPAEHSQPNRCAEERRLLRESLDDAARAFTRLPPERRAELLGPE